MLSAKNNHGLLPEAFQRSIVISDPMSGAERRCWMGDRGKKLSGIWQSLSIAHAITMRSLLGQVPKSAWRGIPAALNGMRVGGLV
jgi:hypothetical protein